MDSSIVLHKTEKGIVEIKTRRYKLASKYRLILILVDGKSDVAVMRNKISKLPNLDKYLVALLKAGFISIGDEKSTTTTNLTKQSVIAKSQMIEAVTSVLGNKFAEPINERFIYAADTPEEMKTALLKCCNYVALTINENKAEAIREMGEKIIARWSINPQEKEDTTISAKATLIEYIISVLGESYAAEIQKRFNPIADKQDDLELALLDYCRLVTFTIDEKKSKIIAKEGKKLLSS